MRNGRLLKRLTEARCQMLVECTRGGLGLIQPSLPAINAISGLLVNKSSRLLHTVKSLKKMPDVSMKRNQTCLHTHLHFRSLNLLPELFSEHESHQNTHTEQKSPTGNNKPFVCANYLNPPFSLTCFYPHNHKNQKAINIIIITMFQMTM